MSEANTDDTVSEANTDDTVSEANTDDTVSDANTDSIPGSANADRPETPGKSRTSEEDMAVVIAILTALTAGTASAAGSSAPASVWADPSHMLRTWLSPGNGSWWASGLPR